MKYIIIVVLTLVLFNEPALAGPHTFSDPEFDGPIGPAEAAFNFWFTIAVVGYIGYCIVFSKGKKVSR